MKLLSAWVLSSGFFEIPVYHNEVVAGFLI